jgi:hypothetical protein
MFNTACNTTAFQVLAQGPGLGNFGLELANAASGSASAPSVPGPKYANYTFDWQQGNATEPLADLEWWSGNISSGTVSGPFINAATRSMRNGGDPGKTWGGEEWWVQGTSGTAVLSNESAWTKIVLFSTPTCPLPHTNCQTHVPHNTTIDPVAVVWTGLNTTPGNASAGKGTSLQTGYVYDAAHPSAAWCIGNVSGCDYGFYFEQSGYLAHGWSGTPRGSPGDIVREEVYNTNSACSTGPGNNWAMEIDDTPLLRTPRFLVHTVCLPEFKPLYAPMIYDSPFLKVAGHWQFQQTPQFSSNASVVFQSGYVVVPTIPPTFYSVVTLWGSSPPSVKQYTMNEELANSNTNESFVSRCGNVYLPGIQPSCQFVEWINSTYDYTYF